MIHGYHQKKNYDNKLDTMSFKPTNSLEDQSIYNFYKTNMI
ncbi:hypothetical protein SAMN06265379_11257 [Saccharicrinis carchari]|uniref:Uncharacterized protein n=1 Tax=Saccharicrinis carchari TaxID=1168039 RepID=A0A521F099_SACCC|nr:hypothetical protein SAMN06265379_11257 [Saccharicrinis carchari]